MADTPAFEKTFLIVPFAEKDRAKALGAKWDSDAKKWYADTKETYDALEEWHPSELSAQQRADALYKRARELEHEADTILAKDMADKRAKFEAQQKGKHKSKYAGVTERNWADKLDASKPVDEREYVINLSIPERHRVPVRQTPEEYYADRGPHGPAWGSCYAGD